MLSTGFLPPQIVFANGQVTGTGYSNPNNILIKDGDVATSSGTADITAGGFLFNLPQNAVVTGIEFKVTASRGAQTVPPIALTFSLYDNVDGANNFYPYTAPFTGLTTSLADHLFGSSTYLFASSFSVDQINNLKLNIQANGNTNIDFVSVNVYYFIQTIVPPPPVSAGCADCDSILQVPDMKLEIPFLIGQTKFYLQAGSFTYADGTPVQIGDIGSCGGKVTWVFDEGERKGNGQNFMENATLDSSLGSWTVLPSGVVEVDLGVVTQRGLQFHTPYGHDALLMSDHDANSKVIISNNGPYDGTLLKKCHIGVLVSAPIITKDENVVVVNPTTKFNFLGAGVVALQDGGDSEQVNITIPGAGGTTPPSVSSTSTATGGNVQSINPQWVHTSIGVNRYLLVQISMEFGKTVTGITFDGTPLVFINADELGGTRIEQWGLVAPNVISNGLISVTLSAASYWCGGAETIVGVDQTISIGTINTNTGTDFNPTVTNVTTYDNSLVIDGLSTALTPILITQGIGQILNWKHQANTDTRQGASSIAYAGTAPDNVVNQYTITQNTDWAISSVEIKGITTTTPGSGITSINADSTPVQTLTPGSGITIVDNLIGDHLISADDESVKVSGTDTTSGFLDPKLNVHSSDGSVVITKTITNPGGNEILDIDLTGAGSSIITTNINEFDDFTNILTSVTVDGNLTNFSGNFTTRTTTFSTEQDHPGIVTLNDDTTTEYLVGFAKQTGTTPTSAPGLLMFENDFDIEWEARLVWSVNTWTANFKATQDFNSTTGSVIGLQIDTGVVKYTIGSGVVVTAVPAPTNNTWFKVRIVNVAGVVTITLDGNLVYTGTPGITGNFYVENTLQDIIGLAPSFGIDYVKTNYTVTR